MFLPSSARSGPFPFIAVSGNVAKAMACDCCRRLCVLFPGVLREEFRNRRVESTSGGSCGLSGLRAGSGFGAWPAWQATTWSRATVRSIAWERPQWPHPTVPGRTQLGLLRMLFLKNSGGCLAATSCTSSLLYFYQRSAKQHLLDEQWPKLAGG